VGSQPSSFPTIEDARRANLIAPQADAPDQPASVSDWGRVYDLGDALGMSVRDVDAFIATISRPGTMLGSSGAERVCAEMERLRKVAEDTRAWAKECVAAHRAKHEGVSDAQAV
jgi:hypothetical protein